MGMYCCKHDEFNFGTTDWTIDFWVYNSNEGASCFYKRVIGKDSQLLEVIEYIPGYGIIMPGVMNTNNIALTVYEHLSVEDRIEFLEYMNQSFIKDRYEIFLKLIKEY